MKIIFCFVGFLLLIGISCQDAGNCHLTGTITNSKEATVLYLSDNGTGNIVDSFTVKNGVFSHKLKLSHPQKFLLHNKINQNDFRDRKIIWLEPSEITISGKYEFLKNLQVTGSASHQLFVNYSLMLEKSNKEIDRLKDRILFNPESDNVEIQSKIDSLNNQLSVGIVAFLNANKNSYFAINVLHTECYFGFRHLNKVQIKTVFDSFPAEFKDSEQGKEIAKYLKLPEPPKIGKMAKEIIQVTPSGDTVRLSDFRGKYVLLDFWASSCGPCRAEFKLLKEIYKEYHPKGFEILSVSGDNSKKYWMDAIEHDSFPWVNISDLKGWKNEAFLVYDIKMIPAKYLINPDGVIIKDEAGIINAFFARSDSGGKNGVKKSGRLQLKNWDSFCNQFSLGTNYK